MMFIHENITSQNNNSFTECCNLSNNSKSFQSLSSVDIGSQCSLVQMTPVMKSRDEDSEDDASVASKRVLYVVKHIASFLSINEVGSLCSLADNCPMLPSHADGAKRCTKCCTCGSPPPELIGIDVECDMFEEKNHEQQSQQQQQQQIQQQKQQQQPKHNRDWEEVAYDMRDNIHRRRMQQEHLRETIFKKQNSIRSYCLMAHQLVVKNQLQQQEEDQQQHFENAKQTEDPETFREPPVDVHSPVLKTPKPQYCRRCAGASSGNKTGGKLPKKRKFINIFLSKLLQNVPLSVALDVSEAIFETSVHSTVALFTISSCSINTLLSILAKLVSATCHQIQNFNPFHHKIPIPFINSSQGTSLSASSHRHLPNIFFRNRSNNSNLTESNAINDKILKKLNRYDSTAKVISYMELDDDTLTEHARQRVQRMMHYQVPLRPFVATILALPDPSEISPVQNSPFPSNPYSNNTSNVRQRFPSKHTSLRSLLDKEHERTTTKNITQSNNGNVNVNIPPSIASSVSQTQLSAADSPFMCTPKSFPPSPSSRSLVMASGTRFAEDVVFLARDQLRVEGGLASANARTRAMARALREGSRLAVFNAQDRDNGIMLSCGQHCATKVSNSLYSSIRSMVPILRNCYVYFEMTIIPPSHAASLNPHQTLASLSIGLSTLEMPLNTLVGSWKSSVGLCTNGQILTGGQWCSPLDPHYCAYGHNSTVGCLVRLDDDLAFQTWDGHMVTASITFNVNSHLVNLPLCGVAPVGGRDELSPSSLYPPGSSSDHPYSSGAVAAAGGGGGGLQHYNGHLNVCNSPENTLRLLVPRQQEIFPTLTLHSGNTQVMCRFSREDIRAMKRESIGAPRGVTVYTVDGSVLFDKSEDMHFPSVPSAEYLGDDYSETASVADSLDGLIFHHHISDDSSSSSDEDDDDDDISYDEEEDDCESPLMV